MSNAFLGYDVAEIATSFSVTNAVTGFPGSNLQKQDPGDYYRTTSSSFVVEIQLSTFFNISAVAMLYHNFPFACAWRVRTATTQANLTNGSANYDSTSIGIHKTSDWTSEIPYNRVHSWVKPATPPVAQWVRIDVTSLTGTMQAGRLMVCVGDIFANKNIFYGSGHGGMEDRGRRGLTTGGVYSTNPLFTVKKNHPIYWEAETDEELRYFKQVYKARGGTKDVLFIRDPDGANLEVQEVVPGLMDMRFVTNHVSFSQRTVRLNIVEIG